MRETRPSPLETLDSDAAQKSTLISQEVVAVVAVVAVAVLGVDVRIDKTPHGSDR